MDTPDSLTRRRALLGGVGVVLAGSGIVYGASTLESDSGPSVTADFDASSETTGFEIDLPGHPIMGSPDAPVDMYYWSDYQCPFCRRFERDTFPEIIRKHVHSGTVRTVFIEFPYMGANSRTAAVMDRCVWRQVRAEEPKAWWRWHTAVFDAQQRGQSSWASKENLLSITADVEDVDASTVEACLTEHRSDIEASIDADIEQASSFGIRGTPAFILYNRDSDVAGRLVGAQPYDRFAEAIKRIREA